MAQTILVGFERNVGIFTDKKTGEVINYSNREIRCITDVGSDDRNIGYTFLAEKFQMSALSVWLNVREDDNSVDAALKSLIHKPVEIVYAPRNGEMKAVAFKPVEKKS